ncbi:hypothetical protein DYJ25_11395 [Prevotella denticola]|nr:hypothetical protein DYJ25_11395 [Prevotella denticola]
MQRKNHETELKCPIGRMIPGNHLFPWSLCQTILYSPGKSVLFPGKEPAAMQGISASCSPAFRTGVTCVSIGPYLRSN